MSLITDLAEKLFAPILQALKKALGPLGKAFDLITHLWRNLTDGFRKGQELAALIMSEISAWRSFKEDIAYRTGVISIPAAVQQTRDLINEVVSARDAIVDLFRQLKGKLTEIGGGNPTEEAEQAVKDIEQSGFSSILKQFPKFARGLEKVLGFVSLLVDTTTTLLSAIDDLLTIVQTLRDLREEVEHGSTVFLQQKNARKSLALKKGGSIRVRIGNLH